MRLSLLSRICFSVAIVGAVGLFWFYGPADANSPVVAGPIAKFAPLPQQPANVPFPTKEWPQGKLEPVSQLALDAAINRAFNNTMPELGETRAILVVQGGKIIAEKYGPSFNKDSKLLSWSMAKSITAAFFAIAMADDKIALEDAIKDPHWAPDDKRAQITYRDAFHMADGLNWREEDYADPTHNDAALMLFAKGREDIVKYVTSRPVKHDVGKVWNYSSGTTNLISAGISRALGPRTVGDPTGKERYRRFMFDRLFIPLGMQDTAPEFDAAGNFYASSLVQASAQDYARFGLLHLRGGMWDGKQIFPKEWIDFIRTPTNAEGATHYGGHWWLSPENKTGLLKNGPYDSFEAHGHEGQVIMVIPSKDMVIVRLGLSTHEKSWDAIGSYLSAIVASVPN